MSKKFKESRMEFDKVLTGIVSTPSRSLICSNFVLDTMEYAVGRMYVSNYFNNESKAAVCEILDYLPLVYLVDNIIFIY